MIVRLLVIVDHRVIVALSALHVAAEEDPADVTCDQVRLRPAIQVKSAAGLELGVGAVAAEHLEHLIERPVLPGGLEQIILPLISRNILIRPGAPST